MAFLFIQPRFKGFLQQQGLTALEDFLGLSGLIICGHLDRHVARVVLKDGTESLSTFLKKEHRVPWRDRLANAWAGFGLVSKSRRELALGPILEQAGILFPEIIAAGEKGHQAFLMTRKIDRAMDLRCCLSKTRDPRQRRRLAHQLGETLARIHDAGLEHPDLYAKHILVEPGEDRYKFWFLDWQRSCVRSRVSWSRRCRDLAALHATLADNLASPRERAVCLQAYLRQCRPHPALTVIVADLQGRARRLLRKRHIREQHQIPLPLGRQNLIWLDGEALCVTADFHTEFAGQFPSWLPRLRESFPPGPPLQHRRVPLPEAGIQDSGAGIQELKTQNSKLKTQKPEARAACLVLRRSSFWLRWLGNLFRPGSYVSPELQQAATLFRLERHGVRLPRLLAVGQVHRFLWFSRSFLVTEVARDSLPLGDWLESQRCRTLLSFEEASRAQVLQQTADTLRRVHQAGYFLHRNASLENLLALHWNAPNRFLVSLRSVESLCPFKANAEKRALADLRKLLSCFSGRIRRTEALRFLKDYLGLFRFTPQARLLAEKILGREPRNQARPLPEQASLSAVLGP